MRRADGHPLFINFQSSKACFTSGREQARPIVYILLVSPSAETFVSVLTVGGIRHIIAPLNLIIKLKQCCSTTECTRYKLANSNEDPGYGD